MPTYLEDGETVGGFTLAWVVRGVVALVVLLTLIAIYNAPGCGPLGHERYTTGTVRSVTAKEVCIEGDPILVELPGSVNCYSLKLTSGQQPPKAGERISAHLTRPLPAMSWRLVNYNLTY